MQVGPECLSTCVKSGIGILPMIYGLEGDPNAELCVGDSEPMPR